MRDRVVPFSSGTEYAEWVAANCDRCKYGFDDWYNCEIQIALDMAYLDDGTIPGYIAAAIGCQEGHCPPCPLLEEKDATTQR